MSFLLNCVQSFNNTTSKPAVHLNFNLSDITPDSKDKIISLVQSTHIQRNLSKSSDDALINTHTTQR